MKLPPLQFDLVEVIWEDAAAHKPEWTTEVSVCNSLVRSAGYLIYCKRDCVVIAQDLDSEGEHNGRTQIPRGMVKSMKVLRRKDRG